MKLSIAISWTVVLLWMGFIFYLSHQPATESKQLSTGVAEVVVQVVEKVAPEADVDVRWVNHIVRKNSHFFAYLILGVLVLNAMRRSGVYGKMSLGLICRTVDARMRQASR